MADISKISLEGNSYNIKDETARADILTINEEIESMSGTMDFIPDINVKYVRYNGRGGYTNVYYAIIPADHKPTLKLAYNQLDREQPVPVMAHDHKSTLTTNAGVYNTNHETAGSIVVDGEFLRENTETFAAARELLLMSKTGRLDVLPYTATEAQIMATDPEWAVQGFYCVVYNFNPTSFAINDTDYAERTLIGQDADGNYISIVCEGRGIESVGFNKIDPVEFCTSVGFTPRILYNLDGGGSSTMVYHGITVNQLAGDTGLTRMTGNALHWISPKANTQGIFDLALTANDMFIAERRERLPINLKPLVTAGTNVDISNISIFLDDSYIHIEGQITTSASIAKYGTLIANMPDPAILGSSYIQMFKSTDKATYFAYITTNQHEMRNASIEALPAGTYYIRTSYRVNPSMALSEGLN